MRKTVGAIVFLTVWALGAAGAQSPSDFAKPQRPVAPIISSSWGRDDLRDKAKEVDQIAARLGLGAGASVADIGAGKGYDTLRLAKLVGPGGQIFAEDVKADYLQGLKASVTARGLVNVHLIVGNPGDPKLAPHSIDAAIMVHMYHEIQDPFGLLHHLAPAFKAGGRLGIEELDRPTQDHGTPPKVLTCELELSGYRLINLAPLEGDLGYFAVFSPPTTAPRPTADQARRCAALGRP